MNAEEQEPPDVPTISRQELEEKFERDDEIVLGEALPEESFEEAHLPGARYLPTDEVRDRAAEVIPDRGTDVVVCCADEDCPACPRTTKILLDMGYESVRDYEGGKEDWRQAGLPMDEETSVELAS